MENIYRAIHKFRTELPAGVRLVAVSKFDPAEMVQQAYDAGQRAFGESRVQEMLAKQPLLPADIRWHFIGHLQTNKVKSIIGKTAMIESIDTEHLLAKVDQESNKAGVITSVLMQVHVAREETKFGFSPEELLSYFAERKFEALTNVHIHGIMGMATNTDDEQTVRSDFARIASLYNTIRESTPDLRGFDILSMGMSGDWPLAVEQGANLIRVGSAIFGPRQY